MKKKAASRVFVRFGLNFADISLLVLALGVNSSPPALAAGAASSQPVIGHSYYNDVSPALRDMPAWPAQARQQREAAENPFIPTSHKDSPDLVVDKGTLLHQLAPSIPTPILVFAGIPYPGVGCFCAPPDPNGEVGTTQYVQMVNEAYQVFDKGTGASLLGPSSIASVWTGFPGVCATSGFGDPIVLFDQIANRWVISEFAGSSIPTDECVAVSTSDDATGTWNRYGFHIGANFIDYPKLGVWPDAYYMSVNVFNSSGTAYLGPQAIAFDRTNMLAGTPATFIAMPILGSSFPPMLPSDLDGATLPPTNAPNSYVLWPNTTTYRVYHFNVGIPFGTTPTFTLFGSTPAASFTQLCPGNRNCVPQLGASSSNKIDAIADRLMHRLAYRNFAGHESLVGTYTVSSGGVAGARWFELRGVTAGPITVYQESTYQPDTTYRFMGSAAMDGQENLAVGFSASSATIHPQLRYAGRLVTDPLNTLAQGEAHLYDGNGAQINTGNRWGDYSSLTIDPVDDATFWYTNEYYDTVSSFNWRTRIGKFTLQSSGGPINLVSAASRVQHGAAGTFDASMPLTGQWGVEDRQVSSYSAVFTFSAPVTSGQVTVIAGVATVGAITFSGNSMIATVTGVTNVQTVTFHTANINGDGLPHGDVVFGYNIGDVDSNRTVQVADRSLIQGQLNQPVTAANFRDDVNANGTIKNPDKQAVNANLGHFL